MANIKNVQSYKNIVSEEIKQEIVKDYVENLLSIQELVVKYKITSKSFIRKVIGDKGRSVSEAVKIAHKRKPESFKLSDETKNKIRVARLNFMKEHPEKTAWRQKNLSYPEKCFIKILSDYGFDKKYLIYREYSVFPYFIDFAFYNEKIAIEIDGAQHLQKERRERDIKKDKLLCENGWVVIHFTAKDVMNFSNVVIEKLREILFNNNVDNIEYVGILTAPKSRQHIQKEENGRTKLQNEYSIRVRKIKERPTKDVLLGLIIKYGFSKTGEMYGVSDNTIRKWCKYYGLPHRKKDLK